MRVAQHSEEQIEQFYLMQLGTPRVIKLSLESVLSFDVPIVAWTRSGRSRIEVLQQGLLVLVRLRGAQVACIPMPSAVVLCWGQMRQNIGQDETTLGKGRRNPRASHDRTSDTGALPLQASINGPIAVPPCKHPTRGNTRSKAQHMCKYVSIFSAETQKC